MRSIRFALSLLASGLATAAPPAPIGDPMGQHFSPLNQITPDNVARLKPAWIYRTGDASFEPLQTQKKSSGQARPILLPDEAGGSLVTCTPYSRVVALDPGTGQMRWEYDPHIPRTGQRGYRCRGVAYVAARNANAPSCAHRVIVATKDRRVIALDARNGKPCAGFGKAGSVELPDYGLDTPGDISSATAPAVGNGVIVIGSSIYDFVETKMPHGTVYALDAETGALRWQFDPLEGISEYGAANVWAGISIDAERDLVFLSTSSPSPDYVGTARTRDGDANSVVALQLSTGKKVWAFATTHHDLWDYDLPAQTTLFDWPAPNGSMVPALAQVTKQGLTFILDRRTGKPLFGVEERRVAPSTIPGEKSSPTQPFPVKPPPLVKTTLTPDDAWGLTFWDRGKCREKIASLENHGLFTPPSEKPFLMRPGSLGGANWGGGAYLPSENLLVVNVNTAGFYGQLLKSGMSAKDGTDHVKAGSALVLGMKGTPYSIKMDVLKSPLGMPCTAPPWGKLVAIDLAKGDIRWEAPLGSIHDMGPVPLPWHIDLGTPSLGGGLMTASGLLFIGTTMDRTLRAFDARTGKKVWHYELPVDATATPMSYNYKGKQYVVINAGGHNMYNRPVGDYFYAFALP